MSFGSQGRDGPAFGKRRFRYSLVRLAVILGAPVLALILLESILQGVGYGTPSEFWIPMEEEQAVVTNQFFGRRFFPDRLARTPEPVRLSVPKPAGTYRIVVVGGSAAMGVPEPAFSFGRVLEVLLRDQYPGVQFEVVNAAMTAINSHVVLPIVKDCARYQPDLFIVYMGNNEVVGPYGPGTIFGRALPSLKLLRTFVWLNATKFGQLTRSLVTASGTNEGIPPEWRGMEMFLEGRMHVDDPRLQQAYRYFRQNLVDICDAARRSGAKVLLSTVATNLKDSPAFASLHRKGLSEANKQNWNLHFRRGVEAEKRGDYSEALTHFERAQEIDNEHADLQFRKARCLFEIDRLREARRHFSRARDLDALRFRADSQLNQIIREVASGQNAEVHLVETERMFQRLDPSGKEIPGDELFYEHVHLRFDGNYLLAKIMLDALDALLQTWVQGGSRVQIGSLSQDKVAKRMALTGWDLWRMKARIADMMERPPFTEQLGYEEKRQATRDELTELEKKHTTPEMLQKYRELYERAISANGHDLSLRRRYAELLGEIGDFCAASAEWRKLLEHVPETISWRMALANVLSSAGSLEESLTQYRKVLEIDPEFAAAYFGIGSVLQKQKKYEAAVAHYEKTLRLNPSYAEAANNLALIAMSLANPKEAMMHSNRALGIQPGYAEAYNTKGLVLLQEGKTEEAVHQFARAAELNPSFAAAHYNWATALVGQREMERAVQHFRKALELRPDYPEAHHGLASVLAGNGRFEEAAHHYAEAARLRPLFAEAHYNLGVLLSRQGKLDQAVSHYAAALRAREDYPEALNNLGTALARQGKFAQAIRAFSRALELKPNFTQAKENLKRARVSKKREQ